MADHQRFLGYLLVASLTLGLGACSTVTKYLGNNDDDGEISPDAISVLGLEENLVADSRIANLQINLPRAYTNLQWPQPGGAPSNAMQHLVLEGELDRLWSRNGGAGNGLTTRMTATPVMANGMVFMLDAEAQVYALDAETGDRVWRNRVRRRHEGRRAGFGGGVAHAVDRVIVTTGYGDVYAFSDQTGEELWRRDVGVPIRTSATVVSGRAFIVTTDNQLLAIDTSDGDVLWNHRAFQESTGLLAATSPAANADVVIAPFTSGELTAVRIQTGSVAWSDQLTRTGNFTPLANINAIVARPVIYNGRVYAISHSGRFVSIDLRTGERIWTADIASTQTPWIVGDFAFVVTVDAELVCVSTRDGRIRWITQMERWRNMRREKDAIQYVGPVLISDRLVVISSEGHLFEYSPYTGEFIAETRVGDPVSLPPIVANNTLYVYSDDADLIAFRGEGEIRQRTARQPTVRQRVNEENAEAGGDAAESEDEGGRFGWMRWPWLSR